MSRENVELLRRANEAFNRGDFDGFLALCHEDLEVEDLNGAPDLPRVAHGKEEVLQAFAAWTDAFGDFRGEIEEYVEVDEQHVGCVVRYRGTQRDTGLVVEFKGVDMWEVRERKLARGTLGYPNRESAVERVEQRE